MDRKTLLLEFIYQEVCSNFNHLLLGTVHFMQLLRNHLKVLSSEMDPAESRLIP
jgi:hypothetical protein